MKWIKPRINFLSEKAKLKDVLLPSQKKRVAIVWGEKYLDYEEVKPTNRINQGKWKLSEEDKDTAINKFFGTNYAWLKEQLNSIPEKFTNILSQCINKNAGSSGSEINRVKQALKYDFNIKNPKIVQLACLNYSNMFFIINASETKGSSKVLKGEDGKPIKDEEGKIIKVDKDAGELVIGTNVGNINTFVTSYNNAYPDEKVDSSLFTHEYILNIINMIEDNPNIIDFDLFGSHDLYLMIEHNAVNILNMSVSKFYNSCQELYFGGGHGTQYMRQLLMNVFDPNSIPAYLIFDTPYYAVTESGKDPEKVSDALPLCRLTLRNIEPFDSTDESEKVIYFDKTYPDRMSSVLTSFIESYSGNKKSERQRDFSRYYFMPDVSQLDMGDLAHPYMDNLSISEGITIGRNTKKLYLSKNYDWTKAIITPDAKIEELIVETVDIPKNFFEIKMELKWVKFKYLQINDLSRFQNIITDSLSFYQCLLNDKFINQLYEISPNLKKLSIGSTKLDINSLNIFKNLEELELLYAVSANSDLKELLNGLSIKKLTISGDMIRNIKNKNYINELKKSGVSVSVKGLVI